MDRLVHYLTNIWAGAVLGVMGVWILLWLWYPFEKLFGPLLSEKHRSGPSKTDDVRKKTLPIVLAFAFLLPFVPIAILLIVLCVCTAWLAIRTLPSKSEHEDHGGHEESHSAKNSASPFRQLLEEFRQRVISIQTMDRPLKLITITGIAQLSASGLLVLFQNHTANAIQAIGIDGEIVEVGKHVLLATTIFLAFGWSLILSGGWERKVSRIFLVVLFIAVCFSTNAAASNFLPGTVGMSAVLVGAVLLSIRRSQDKSRVEGQWHYRRLFLFSGLIVLYFAWPLIRSLSAGGANSAGFFGSHVFRLTLILAPVLFLAGSDFAEFGEAVSRTVARLLEDFKPRPALAIAALMAAGGTIWLVLRQGPLDLSRLTLLLTTLFGLYFLYRNRKWNEAIQSRLPSGLKFLSGLLGLPLAVLLWAFARHVFSSYIAAFLIMAVFLTILYVAQRLHVEAWHFSHVPFSMLAIAALFLAGTREAVTLAYSYYGTPSEEISRPKYKVQLHPGPETWSIPFPDSWKTGRTEKDKEFFHPNNLANTGLLLRVLQPNDPTLDGSWPVQDWTIAQIWPYLKDANFDSRTPWNLRFEKWLSKEGTWYTNGTYYSIEVFARKDDDKVWFMATVCPAKYQSYYRPIFDAMVENWQPNLSAEMPSGEEPILSETATHPVSFGLLPCLLTPVGLLLLFYKPAQGPRGTPRDIAGLFLIVTGAVSFFFLPTAPLTESMAAIVPLANPFNSLQLLTAALSIIAAIYNFVKRGNETGWRLLVGLFELNIGLLFLHLIYWLYGTAVASGQKSVAAKALVLVGALAWDLLMSGKEITNIDSASFRRPARVMLYIGYVALVCTCILYLTSLTNAETHKPTESFFEAEEIVRQGIVWLATPCLLMSFLFRVRLWDYMKSSEASLANAERLLGAVQTASRTWIKRLTASSG